MRLICPNCDAQYDVPETVMPPEGRDVQCSNCGQAWFQEHPAHPQDVAQEPACDPETDAPEAVQTTPPAGETDKPARRELDPAVADVLRAEAELEAQARRRESAVIESQPELGLPESSDDAARQIRRARMEADRTETAAAPKQPMPQTRAAPGPRRDLLPDIEEINSTLRANGNRTAGSDAEQTARVVSAEKRNARYGFLLTVALATSLVLVYVYAPQIEQELPGIASLLDDYVIFINAARLWLDDQVAVALAWLNDIVSQVNT